MVKLGVFERRRVHLSLSLALAALAARSGWRRSPPRPVRCMGAPAPRAAAADPAEVPGTYSALLEQCLLAR